MIHCQNCGKQNELNVNFCRFCGNGFGVSQTQQSYTEQSTQSRPYMWKTDEFQVNPPTLRQTNIEQARTILPVSPNQTQQLAYQQPSFITNGYRCPRCGSQNLPITKRQISNAGWIVFAVLLLTTGFFFWVGLLIKEDVRVCQVCNCKVG